MSKKIVAARWELVLFGGVLFFAGFVFQSCIVPARAGIMDDATAIRRAVEHIDRVMTRDFVNRYRVQP